MNVTDVECSICGTQNEKLDLDETDGQVRFLGILHMSWRGQNIVDLLSYDKSRGEMGDTYY